MIPLFVELWERVCIYSLRTCLCFALKTVDNLIDFYVEFLLLEYFNASFNVIEAIMIVNLNAFIPFCCHDHWKLSWNNFFDSLSHILLVLEQVFIEERLLKLDTWDIATQQYWASRLHCNIDTIITVTYAVVVCSCTPRVFKIISYVVLI